MSVLKFLAVAFDICRTRSQRSLDVGHSFQFLSRIKIWGGGGGDCLYVKKLSVDFLFKVTNRGAGCLKALKLKLDA